MPTSNDVPHWADPSAYDVQTDEAITSRDDPAQLRARESRCDLCGRTGADLEHLDAMPGEPERSHSACYDALMRPGVTAIGDGK